jgi:hypothetical protein
MPGERRVKKKKRERDIGKMGAHGPSQTREETSDRRKERGRLRLHSIARGLVGHRLGSGGQRRRVLTTIGGGGVGGSRGSGILLSLLGRGGLLLDGSGRSLAPGLLGRGGRGLLGVGASGSSTLSNNVSYFFPNRRGPVKGKKERGFDIR